MKIRHLFVAVICCLFLTCKEDYNLTKIEGKRIEINDSLNSNSDIENFIRPYRERVDKELDSVIAYAKDYYQKGDGELNSTIGNLMADAILELGSPIYKTRTGHAIDIAMSNYGGIRADIDKGPITARTGYEIMPFENTLMILQMKGSKLKKLVDYLCQGKRAHPIAGLTLKVNKDYELVEALVNSEQIEDDKIYHLATIDYLYNGGDGMGFLKENEGVHNLNYKLRNVLIDYFKKHDTIQPTVDDRFIKIN